MAGSSRKIITPSTFSTPFDEYRLIKQIGQGGTGFVVSATDAEDKLLAVKYLDPEKTARKLRKRFENEIRFGLRTNHKNVMPIVDVGLVEFGGKSVPFYVMPLFESTLRREIDSGMPPAKVLDVFGQMLAGVEAAHREGIWHRDLKPENILVQRDLSTVVVGDFGIAHFSEIDYYTAVETQAADRLANFRYYAPEQAKPTATRDHRVDIFALGLMLNEMFTQERPHGTEPPAITSIAPQFGYLDDVVALMTRQKPSDRPSSIEQVRAEITARAKIHAATEELETVRRAVLSDTDPNDPYLANPIHIIDKDWESGVLKIKLSGSPPLLWKQIFASSWRASFRLGGTPDQVSWIRDDRFSVESPAEDAKGLYRGYTTHISAVNEEYSVKVRRLHAGNLERLREESEKVAMDSAKRLQVLKSLRL